MGKYLLVLLILEVTIAKAQEHKYRDDLIFGMHIGTTISKTGALESTILSEPTFLNYSLKPKTVTNKIGCFGAFINYRFENPKNEHIGFQGEITYTKQSSRLDFVNTEKDFFYTMDFNYEYLNVAGLFNWYFGDYDNKAGGFHIGAGVSFGVNLSSEGIRYQSGGPGYLPAFGTDEQQQQQLNNVLKAKNNPAWVFGTGWEFRNCFFKARLLRSMGDIVDTQVNSYNFEEKDNKNTAILLTIGISFPWYIKGY